MSLDRAFRMSFYLTLALAAACLGYAEYPLLPEMALLLWPMGLALVAGFLLEGRWSMTIGVANGVAVFIAGAVGLWTLYRLFQPPINAVEGAPLLLRLLPHLGFLLIVLMLALLFRPKQLSNYWFLYGISFVAVALACALDSDFVFGLLLLAFVGCGLWSLAIFYLWSGVRFPRASRAGPQADGARAAPVPWLGFGTWQAARRCLLIAALAFVLFSLTPRAAVYPWDLPGSGQMLASSLGEPIVDLNRTGTVRLSKSVAFAVKAEDGQHQPKLNLDPGQRWRNLALHNYENGRWFNRPGLTNGSTPGERKAEEPLPPVKAGENLPDLGPGQFFLTMTFSGRLAGRRLVFAEPVTPASDPPCLPVKFLKGGTPPAWQLSLGIMPPTRECIYTQVVVPVAEPGLSVPLPGDEPRHRYGDPVNVPGVRDWTVALLQRLVARGTLRRADIELDEHGRLPARHHEQVARALESYLSASGDYTYTLELSRRDPKADPVYDFLCNVKQGHCERFASALAAMLRTLGVPARLVLGYRGIDSQGDGTYLVRDSHAHSWVEVFVERPGPNGPQEHWLTLDPTPAAERQGTDGLWGNWWRLAQQGGGAVWRSFIIDYDAERQEAAVLEVLNRLGLGERPRAAPSDSAAASSVLPWLWVGAGLVGIFVGWRLWRRLRRHKGQKRVAVPFDAVTSFYGRLLALLARRRALHPAPAQTPHEFAVLVGGRLRNEPNTAALADMPEQLTRLYYRVRYAARPLSAAERAHVDDCLERLDQSLRLRNA
jgi:protein-glutamine gamma-glutamyltransferase